MSYDYEDAVDRGYDGPSPAQERRMERMMLSCDTWRGGPNACGICESCTPPTCKECGVDLRPEEEDLCEGCKPPTCKVCEDELDEVTEDGMCTCCREEG